MPYSHWTIHLYWPSNSLREKDNLQLPSAWSTRHEQHDHLLSARLDALFLFTRVLKKYLLFYLCTWRPCVLGCFNWKYAHLGGTTKKPINTSSFQSSLLQFGIVRSLCWFSRCSFTLWPDVGNHSRSSSLYCALVSPTTVIAFVTASVSLMTTTAIAVDRYLAFCLKLRYKDLVRVKRVVLVLALEWLIGILWAGLWVHSRSASHTVGALANCLCTMTNFVCYLKIFFGLKQRRTFPIPVQNQFESNQIMYFNILIYKKSAKNMFIIYSIMLFCYVPYSLALALQFAYGVNSSTFFTLSISYTIILVNSSLNPFVYFWRIREIRGQVLAMFKKLKSHGHINS